MPSGIAGFSAVSSVSSAYFPRGLTKPCAGTPPHGKRCRVSRLRRRRGMYSIVYIVGLVVIVLAILSFLGLR
jgi:hypothetical protein